MSDLARHRTAKPDPARSATPAALERAEGRQAAVGRESDDILAQALRGDGPELERIPAEFRPAVAELLAVQDARFQGLAHEKLRLQTEFKAALARAEALERELKTTRQALRTRDAELQAIHGSVGWLLARSLRGILKVARGQLSVRTAVLHAARVVYRRLPLSEVTRRRIGERLLGAIRVARSLNSRFRVPKPVPAPPRAAPQRLSFPLPGSITALPELLPEPPPGVDASVSVIIPTLNAGSEFVWLLRKLRAQKGLRAVEIVVVDSGSTDGTVERAREAGCKLVQIEKAEFSHSFARNLGAEHASGDLLLFTVQDAYPVGDYWLSTLARCLLHPRTEDERLAAVSCAEFPRSDSELLYNALINTHYRFLGCADRDRIGQLTKTDNESLRTEGQLSDVACMMERATFERYMYQGRYAEDLILGIRLIRDGHRVGMLSSVKVIHSHNRPVGYYVRRVFVDNVFLSDVFPDFRTPEATSILGTFAAACHIRERLQPVSPSPDASAADVVRGIIRAVRELKLPQTVPDFTGRADFGFAPLGAFVESVAREASRIGTAFTPEDQRDAERIRAMFVDRLTHLCAYLDETAPVLDESVARELTDAVEKTLAMALGTQLAFIHLTAELQAGGPRTPRVAELKPMLLAGI